MKRKVPAMVRKIGGLRFNLRTSTKRKSDAKRAAQRYRKKFGYLARVVKFKGRWHVYTGRRRR